MGLLAPFSLLWLLLVAPVIILLYLLKLRRREVEVSSVYLWSQLLQDLQANAPLQKLRRNLLLFLQLIAATALIAALARPARLVAAPGGENVVVVLDGSASMQSRDESAGGQRGWGVGGADGGLPRFLNGTRFQAAKRAVSRMIEGMGRGDAMMILLATSRTRVLAPFTTDRGELRAALAGAEPRETTTNLGDALALALSASRARRARRDDSNPIYVLSDGAFGELEDLPVEGAGIEFLKFGKRSNNVGIVAMDVRRGLGGEGEAQTFVALRNASDTWRDGVLSLYRDGSLIDARDVKVPPRATTGEVIATPASSAALLEARLELDDDLEADNVAYTQVAPRREVRVLLVSAGNFFLERALTLEPNVQVSRVGPAGYARQAGYDVVIFDRVTPRSLGPGNLFYVGATGPECPAIASGEAKHPTVLDTRAHPVTRYVSLPSTLAIERALASRPQSWASSLIDANTGPLVVAGEREGRRSLFLSFGVERENSNFGLKVSFPIFVSNALQWLASRPGEGFAEQIRAGQVVPIDAGPETRQITVIDPDGRRHAVPVQGRAVPDLAATALFDATERRGVYRVLLGKSERRFAVNLLSAAESDTRPADRMLLSRRTIGGGGSTTRTTREVWRWAGVLALLILGLEWYAYHRRV